MSNQQIIINRSHFSTDSSMPVREERCDLVENTSCPCFVHRPNSCFAFKPLKMTQLSVNTVPFTAAQKNLFMTQNGFTMYMLSRENDVLNPDHARVYQDMSRPLAHYFISSSHNTYLTKDQVTSASSTEPYIRYSENHRADVYGHPVGVGLSVRLSPAGLWIRAVAAWSWTAGMETKGNLSSTTDTLSPPKWLSRRSLKPSTSTPSRYEDC